MTQHAMTETTEQRLGGEPTDHEAAKVATLAAIKAARSEMRRYPENGDEQRPDTSTEPGSLLNAGTADAPVSIGAAGTLELRVIQGPQMGARTVLSRTHTVITTDGDVPAGIAEQDESADILLFDDPSAPVRIRLACTDEQTAVQVLRGQIRLHDQILNAGEKRAWKMYQPLTIGQSIIAYGLSAIARWPTHGEDGTALEPGGEGTDMPDTRSSDTNTGKRHRANTSLTTFLGGVAVICTAAFWQLSTGADDSLHAPVLNPVDLAAQMRSSPFAQLSAVRQPDGEFLVRGRLATRAERRALDAWLVEHDVTARVDVIVDDVLARDVAEVFRVNGVNVRTTVAGPGQIQAVADEPDSARLADAATAVRRDVRSLVRLDVKNTAKPAPPPLPKVSADPNKRIVSVVPGSPGYLITADGARYFVGAMLPTGHRVARIGRASVTLELAGQTSRLEL